MWGNVLHLWVAYLYETPKNGSNFLQKYSQIWVRQTIENCAKYRPLFWEKSVNRVLFCAKSTFRNCKGVLRLEQHNPIQIKSKCPHPLALKILRIVKIKEIWNKNLVYHLIFLLWIWGAQQMQSACIIHYQNRAEIKSTGVQFFKHLYLSLSAFYVSFLMFILIYMLMKHSNIL